jgi:hypothetical protein
MVGKASGICSCFLRSFLKHEMKSALPISACWANMCVVLHLLYLCYARMIFMLVTALLHSHATALRCGCMHRCHTQGRVQAVCQQLQADISRMKSARAAVQRRMESKEKEFREWRLMREREVLQLRRNAQRQSAALQQHQAMHSKQQVRM